MSQKPVGLFSRRSFLATSGAAVAAAAVAPHSTLGQAGPARAPVRVALVGTGVRGTSMWGRDLVQRWADTVQFVGLSDINPGRLAYGKQYMGVDVPTFTDLGQMLRETRPERLIVTTKDSTHHDMIIRAMEAGVDVITEKPLTTDETKLQSILDAQKKTGRDIVVTFNYRYSPHRQRIWEILRSGRIGKITSADFHWYLDTSHGADYFRRWHGKRESSGTLLVHKASHHFDLLNWWLDSDPAQVYATGALDYYGKNNPFRHTQCRGCPHAQQCQHYWDITRNQHLVNLYVKNEQYDGYKRDGCVWDEKIDIFDKMGAQISYANGVNVSYSLTTYSPYEGYRIAFNGTKGRLDAWIKESQPWEEPEYDELRVTDNFGESEIIQVPHGTSGHGGGDDILRDRIFRDPNAPDQYGQKSGLRDGAFAVLVGFAARKSIDTGEPVKITDISSLDPRAAKVRA
jgi:predicted dehydrogenase